MGCRSRHGSLAIVFLIVAGACGFGCASGRRNLRESIVVTASPSFAESEVKVVLELRDGREEFALPAADAFLASERGARLDDDVRSRTEERCEALRRTLPHVRDEWSDGLVVLRSDPRTPYADGNIVLYLEGKSGVRLLFSTAEIGQVLAFHAVADDLATIVYTHPDFDPRRLGAAAQDPAVVEQIVHSNDPNLIRAFIHLVRQDVVETQRP